jgi:signal recognition particle subunit SRP54
VFESLSARLGVVLDRVRGKAILSEDDIKAAMREVRLALLEADVDFKVVRDLVAVVTEKAAGSEVNRSLTPGQEVIKIVHAELQAMLGGTGTRLRFATPPPTVILLSGLQGSGKTTTAAKLAAYVRKQGHRPLLVGLDLARPAALHQLDVVGEQVGAPVWTPRDQPPAKTAEGARGEAARRGADVIILDSAGRLGVDAELMAELQAISRASQPTDSLLVLDAMTGQDAVRTAQAFDSALSDAGRPLDGVIMTKLDGDARGGAALSLRAVTGRPIVFAGVGEKLDALEPFDPDRVASRILGMGDVLTLIERAQEHVDQEQAERAQRDLMAGHFDFQAYLEQMEQVRKMGPIGDLLGMIPGMGKLKTQGAPLPTERDLDRVSAIIQSMTAQERRHPELLNASRKRRIAAGSGTRVEEVNQLVRSFEQMRQLFKQMGRAGRRKGGMGGLMGGLGGLPGPR